MLKIKCLDKRWLSQSYRKWKIKNKVGIKKKKKDIRKIKKNNILNIKHGVS